MFQKFILVSCLIFGTLLANENLDPSKTVEVPMRDGKLLSMDLYFPKEGNPSDYPLILVRSPAGKRGDFVLPFAHFTKAGYVVAIQETRCVREKRQFPYFADGFGHLQDGADTIRWIEKSSYSNGVIGTIGYSAAGITQFLLAPTAPDSLKSQYIGVAPSSLYHHALFWGGQFSKEQVEGWLCYYKKDPGVQCFASNQTFYNDFWKLFDSNQKVELVRAPAFFYAGWYDIFLQGTIDGFLARDDRGGKGARGNCRLVLGPWTHLWPVVNTLGDFEIPKESLKVPLEMSPVAWFDYTLKGKKSSFEQGPHIAWYVMGPFDGTPSKGNVWKTGDTWPPTSEETPIYLTHDEGLSYEKPSKVGTLEYTYNPSNPVPTIGGKNLFMESGPKDQRCIEEREDVLTFTSEPLQEDLEVTGKVVAKIYFSSDRQDTDLVVRVTDVYPDGRSVEILDGITRIGLERCFKDAACLESCEYTVDLWSTSMVFAKGHKIRVIVTSSNYPRFERNRNVGIIGANRGIWRLAKNKVWTGAKTPSRIVLPLIKSLD